MSIVKLVFQMKHFAQVVNQTNTYQKIPAQNVDNPAKTLPIKKITKLNKKIKKYNIMMKY